MGEAARQGRKRSPAQPLTAETGVADSDISNLAHGWMVISYM